MRIIGGRFKGTRLAAPGVHGGGIAHLRPTSDRVRESLFNLLAHGGYRDIAGMRVLDLFAGTGALGFEALSRGASRAVFIDDGAAARGLIRQNIEALGVIGQTKLWRRDATRLGPCRGDPFDLVFADPPYGKGLGLAAVASARAGGWIAPGALIILEETTEAGIDTPPDLTLEDERTYGDTRIMIFQDNGNAGLGSNADAD
ncbi:MAG: 16S rRNA (guanine(966)-N(2))-methyltransferase RsmD [Pseudomonadota bacterium]